VDGDGRELLARDRVFRFVARVDVGALEELEEASLLGRAVREDVSQRG
jgi:hypothetical protein